jgi:protein gp37
LDPAWARAVRAQCRAAGVPLFVKQMSKKAPIPPDLLIRQFPAVRASERPND